jgi:hypothetical protein
LRQYHAFKDLSVALLNRAAQPQAVTFANLEDGDTSLGAPLHAVESARHVAFALS